MKQHVTILVTSHNELTKVHEARGQMITKMKNSVTLLRTKTIKFDENIRTILTQITSQIMQMDKKNEDSTARIAIASVENDKAKRILIFCCVNISNDSINRSSNMATDVVPAIFGKKPKHKSQRSAQAYKITGLIKDQLESVHWNSSTPIALQDLQWRSRPNEESYRQQFLETFHRYNANLRGLENYYASETCRYTIIQNNLLPCIGIMHKKSKCLANVDQSLKHPSHKDSQSYRIILKDDERSKSIAERRGAVEARSEFEESVVNENYTSSEMESLKKENELLGSALRRAADAHINLLGVVDANLKEKDKWSDERRAIEENCNDLLARNEELQKLALAQTEELERLQSRAESEANSLREERALLEEQRRCIENDRQDVLAQKEEVERLQSRAQSEASRLREERALLEEQRRCIENDRQDLLAQKEEVERLQSRAQSEASRLREERALLEEQRRCIENDRQDVSAQKEEVERLQLKAQNEVTVARASGHLLANDRRALEQERILFRIAKTEFDKSKADTLNSLRDREKNVEETERSMGNQRRALESDQQRVSEQRRELEAEANRLRERQRTMDARIENLENAQRQLSEERQGFEAYCEASNYRLAEMQNAIEAQRQELERQRRNLMEERRQQTSTLSNGNTNDDGYIEIPYLQIGVKLRPWRR